MAHENSDWTLVTDALPTCRINVIDFDSGIKQQVFARLSDDGTWYSWQPTSLDEGWIESKSITHWHYMAADPA